jgi:hypothetical protein
MSLLIYNLCDDIVLEILKHCSILEKLCFSSTCKSVRRIAIQSKSNFFPFYQPWEKCQMYLQVQRLLFLLEETESSSVAIYLLPPIKQINWSILGDPTILEKILNLPVYLLNKQLTNGICQHISRFFLKPKSFRSRSAQILN